MNFFKKQSNLEFPTEIKISDTIFLIEVILSNKKNSSVSLKDNKFVFRLTSKGNNKQIQSHFDELLKKMILKVQKQPFVKKKCFNDFLEIGKFNFAGDEYKLEHTKTRGIKLKENIFYINYQIDSQILEKYIAKLLSNKYYERLKNYVDVINSQTYSFKINKFDLKLVQSKWGHCSHDNSIMLNLKLLNAQSDILDYVIIHELAHIKVKNHSSVFWREVEKFCPNYKELRNKLKQNPPQLFS